MKCEECIEHDESYCPNRCMHKSNVVYLDAGGMYCKHDPSEINPNGDCELGQKK